MAPNDSDLTATLAEVAGEARAPAAPIARRQRTEQILHGDRRVDDYAWLREKSNPEVLAYLNRENAYTSAMLRSTETLQEQLYQEMLGRIQQTDLSVPYLLRGYCYFTRTEEGKQYPAYLRQRYSGAASASPGAIEIASPETQELLLDLNALAEGHSFLGLGAFEVSDNNQLLAYSTDNTGFRQYTLYVKDLSTGALLPPVAERVTSVAWAADNRTLFYTVEDAVTKRSHRLYRHVLGSGEHTLLYEEPDERFRIEIERTRSQKFLLLNIASHTTTEIHFLPAAQPRGSFRVIAARQDEHEYYADHHGGPDPDSTGTFYIRTNSLGRTFGLMAVADDDPRRVFWREVIPSRPQVMLAGIGVFRSHLVLYEREGGLPHIRIADLQSLASNPLADSYRIEFAEPAYNASLSHNPEFDTDHVRYQYESFVTPRSVYDFDFATRRSILRKQQPVLGGYDSSQYLCERLHATASDGTQVPISLVYRRSTPRDSSAALLLYGYGSYGISTPVNFSSNRLSLLDRGFIFAIAHVRGGGELGKPWHDAGRMRNKLNTFTDFISAAEFLVARGYTSPQKLVIEGGSAGGLLMGAVCNMRPELFRAVISHVPFVDVLNTMLDASLPLTVGEYEEWGNPQIAADYFFIKSYCPYSNIERKNYPAMLVRTGLNDSQVMYWEPAKYVAKLRALKTDTNPLLFQINMGAGHGGASGRYDYLREVALDYAFLLTQVGLAQ